MWPYQSTLLSRKGRLCISCKAVNPRKQAKELPGPTVKLKNVFCMQCFRPNPRSREAEETLRGMPDNGSSINPAGTPNNSIESVQ